MLSVLLSVYQKEHPHHLARSLDSILNQTLPPRQVVMVKDGPLTGELDAVLHDYAARYPILELVPLKINQGLGRALNAGLKRCTGEWVARMDTDDIARPDRFEKQLALLRSDPNIDVVGSWIDEFEGGTERVVATRRLPHTHDELLKYAKRRNPMNHMSVIFRKSAVLRAGGYRHFPLFEDYYLWVRMLMGGARMANVQESLVLVRVSPEMYERRGGRKYASDEYRLQREFRRIGFISGGEMLSNLAVRTAFRFVPNSLRGWIYKNVLRK